MGEFSVALDETARKLSGINADELQELSASAAQLGVRGSKSILNFAATMGKLNIATNINGPDGAAQVASILQLSGANIDQVGKLGDLLTTLGNNLGGLRGGEQSILDNATLLAQATAKFKLSYQDIVAIAGAGAKLQFKPELFGSVVGRTFNQLENAAVNNTKAMRDFSAATGITAEQFEKLIKENPAEALDDFLKVMKATADGGGSMQQFLQDWNLYAEENQRVLGTLSQQNDARKLSRDLVAQQMAIQSQANAALEQEYKTVNDTLNNNIKNLGDSFTLLQKDVGAAFDPLAKGSVKTAVWVLDGLDATLKGLGPTTQSVAVGVTALAVAALPLASAFRLAGAAFAYGWPLLATTGGWLVTAGRGAVSFGTAIRGAASVMTSFEGVLLATGSTAAILSSRLAPVAKLLGSIAVYYGAYEGAKSLLEGPQDNEKKYTTGFGVQDFIRNGGDAAEAWWNGYTKEDETKARAYTADEARKREMAKAFGPLGASAGSNDDTTVNGRKVTVALRLIEEQMNNIKKLDTWTEQNKQVQEYRVALDQLAKISAKQAPGQGDAVSSKELARLNTLYDVAKRLADPTAQRVYELEKEQAMTGAVTKEQKNQLEISEAILGVREEKGIIDQEEIERLTKVLQQTQAIRAAAEAEKQNYQLDNQLAAARQRSSLGQQQVEIEQRIADLIREQGLNQEQANNLRQKMTDIANLQAFNQLADTADPVTAAIRHWVDDSRRLKDAYENGLIPTAEKYAQIQQNLDRQTQQARDPIGFRVKSMREELQAAQYVGDQAEIERDLIADINQLKDQGVAVTVQQEQALRDYITSMYQLKTAQEASLQAWAAGLGTWQKQLGELQMSTADAISDGLVDGFVDGDWKDAAQNMLKNIAKTYLKSGIDAVMAGIIQKTGIGDNGGKKAFANAAAAAGQLDGLGQAALTANTAYVNAGSVIIGGGAGSAPLGSVARSALGPVGGTQFGSRVGSSVDFARAGNTSISDYISLVAQANGIDPSVALRVARSEGGVNSWNMQSLATRPDGSREQSFGPYQLYMNGGLGNKFQAATGLDPRLAQNGPAGVNYALQYASQNGWGSWYGAGKAGISNMQGIGTVAPEQIARARAELAKLGNAAQTTGSMTAAAGTNVGSFSQQVQQTGPAAQTAGNNVQQMNTKLASTTPNVSTFASTLGSTSASAAGATTNFAGLGQGLAGLFSSIGGSLGGGAGQGLGILGSLFSFMFHHNGGLAGQGTPGIGFGSWSGVRKFHTGGGDGLNQDEYRAVLKQGERVLTEDDDNRTQKLLKAKGKSAVSGGMNVGGISVNVNAAGGTGDKAKDEEYSRNLGKTIAAAIDQQMTEWTLNQMRPGGILSGGKK
ncbi:tail tape measure protein [Rhizobium phage RHph_TM16]|nr:tail tape measure protein [Rhizobium phage RHph_TM16]